jgi:hypothetical protein
MKNTLIGILLLIGFLTVTIGMSYGAGWLGVHQKKTIGKAMQNAERTVFEESQSYVEGKRQEAARMYREHKNANDTDKVAICGMVGHTFTNFNLTHLKSPVREFVYNCTY